MHSKSLSCNCSTICWRDLTVCSCCCSNSARTSSFQLSLSCASSGVLDSPCSCSSPCFCCCCFNSSNCCSNRMYESFISPICSRAPSRSRSALFKSTLQPCNSSRAPSKSSCIRSNSRNRSCSTSSRSSSACSCCWCNFSTSSWRFRCNCWSSCNLVCCRASAFKCSLCCCWAWDNSRNKLEMCCSLVLISSSARRKWSVSRFTSSSVASWDLGRCNNNNVAEDVDTPEDD
mmetsp:Transcript_4753/g.9916  ORF Transcript_4753/g.9916 Transcript_4753/m.9916 type:complete len:231 (+) Transcript_4753:93-785(+)